MNQKALRETRFLSPVRVLATLALGWLLLAGSRTLAAAGSQPLAGHVPALVKGMPTAGRLPGTNWLHLAIGLPLRPRSGQAQHCPVMTSNFHEQLLQDERRQVPVGVIARQV